MTTARQDAATARHFRTAANVGSVGAACCAGAGLLGLVAPLQLLGSVRVGYVPMAPSTAVSLLLLSAALFLHVRHAWRGTGRQVMAAMLLAVAVYGLLVVLARFTGLDLALEARVVRGFGTTDGFPNGRMSPLTGGTFVLAGIGTFLLMLRPNSSQRARRVGHVASFLGLLCVLVAATVLMAYLYGAPLMYGGTAVPMAITTAVAFVLLGGALVAAAGPASLPARLVVGDSTSARLSRAFFPLPIIVMLVESVLDRLEIAATVANHALFLGGLVTAVLVITLAIVARVAHATGLSLDERTRLVAESAARTRAITQSTSDAIITADGSGILVDWNPGAEAIFGYAESEVVGKPLVMLMPDAFQDAHTAGLRRVAEGGPPRVIGRTVELQGRRKDGTVFPLELSLSQWNGADGRHFAGIIRDITDRKRAAAEHVAVQEQMASLQKLESIGLLAGGVAHEFNNMLAAIVGNAELTARKLGEGHAALGHVEAIRKSAQRSADLTGQLLVFARKQAMALKVLDLNETVTGIVDMLRAMLGEHVQVVWVPGDALWPIEADATQVDQALANLAFNARDAMVGRDGVLAISTSNVVLDAAFVASHPGAQPGAFVCLHVHDNGMGMDAKMRGRIFEPFFTTKPPGKGTGLGLPMVLGIVQQHGGHVTVESTPGAGTSFCLYFPRAIAQVEAAQPAAEEISGGTGTILLVEDDAGVLRATAEILGMLGYTVLAATGGAEAMAQAMSHQGEIDLLLADVVMPGIDGTQLRDALMATRPGVKVLYMSGYDPEELVAKYALAAGTTLLRKPFSLPTLAEAVRSALAS